MCVGLHVKCPLFLSDFMETRIKLTNFRKILKYKILWEAVLWEPRYFMRTDGRTDGEAKNRLTQFCEAPEKPYGGYSQRVGVQSNCT